MMRDLFRFIGVDDRFVADTSTRYNSATWPRMGIARPLTARVERMLSGTASRLPSLLRAGAEMRLARLLATVPPPLDPTLRSDLTERYRDDILRTQDLIDRDLSHWLK